MASLYELTSEYMTLLDFAEDPDVDPETLADTMEAIGGELEDKAQGYACVIRQIESDCAGIKAELDRLSARKKTMENNIQKMKDALQAAMIATGKKKFKTPLFSFGIQKNPATVVLDVDEAEVPDDYLIPQPSKINKAKLKDDLKAGLDVGIAHLEQRESLRIK